MKQLKNLTTLLSLLDTNKAETLTVYEHFVLNKGNLGNKLSIRIDVDFGLACAEELAIELNKRHVRASFYFLTLTAPYNIFNDCIRKIAKLGHEVGLHSDHLYLNKELGLDSMKLLKNDIEILSTLINEPIKGLCFHGNGKFEAQHNWTLYRELEPEKLGLRYHDGFTSSYCDPSNRNMWTPPVENYLSDDPDGWLTTQKGLIDFFKRVNTGESSHLIIHPQYFFEPSSWQNNNYHEKPVPLPKHSINRMAKMNKLIKFALNKVFILAEVVIRWVCILMMHLTGSKKRKGLLEDFDKMDFIEQSYFEPNNYQMIIDNLGLKTDDKVLDLGFGAGQFLFLTGAIAKEVHGIEPDEKLFAYVKDKIASQGNKNIYIVKGVGEKLPYETFSFDKAICMSVLMMTNPYSVLKELNRVLKQKGEVTLHVSDLGYSFHSLHNGITCKNPSRIKGTLRQLVARYRRSVLRQYDVGGVFTSRDLEKLAKMTGFEIVKDLNEGYYDWEPKVYWGYKTQHLITLRKTA